MFHRKRRSWSKGLVAGLIGGTVGSWTMNVFQAGLSKLQSTAKTKATEGSESQEPATVKAAVAIAEQVLHRELQPEQKPAAGSAVHYGFGCVVGAGYGLLAEYVPDAMTGQGSLFGSVVWLVADEIAVPLSGLSKPPQEYPAGVHASALAAHWVYGVTTEFVRRALRKGYLAA